MPVAVRLALLVLGGIALVVGILAGLARMGVSVPNVASGHAAWHGPLMIGGFFGVVISLERAVALGRTWAYAAPLLAGLATLAALVGWVPVAPWLLVAAGFVLAAATLDVFRRQRALFTFTLLAGTFAWLAGSLAWAMGQPPHASTWTWLAFLVLTIAGERLELSRFLPPSAIAHRIFALVLALCAAGLAVAFVDAGGVRLVGLAWLALAVWLLKQDIARRTVRARGLTRYVAVCLLSGYFWLAIGSFALLAEDVSLGRVERDAALHAIALGFVFAMVFGHGPIIVPAVLRVTVPYHPMFYLPLALLHATLVLRLAGDVMGAFTLLRAGAIGNALAILAFIVTMLTAVLRGRRAPISSAT